MSRSSREKPSLASVLAQRGESLGFFLSSAVASFANAVMVSAILHVVVIFGVTHTSVNPRLFDDATPPIEVVLVNAKSKERPVQPDVLAQHDLPEHAITSISTASRDELKELLELNQYIDLVIPRGGRELIEFVCHHSTIPTVQHFHGVCHIFVDESADLRMAIEVCDTAKSSAPATCNAAECILVHKNIAERFVPVMIERYQRDGVEVRGTPLVLALAPASAAAASLPVKLAESEDFGHEFLDLIVAMRTVDSVDEAIDHINTYGSNHTESILTQDLDAGGSAERFCSAVQSSCVLVNASTRFNDGFSLGLGAEIGISTSRIHAYGPMGLEELTTQRWIVEGSGQTR